MPLATPVDKRYPARQKNTIQGWDGSAMAAIRGRSTSAHHASCNGQCWPWHSLEDLRSSTCADAELAPEPTVPYRQRCNGGEPHQAPSPPQTRPATGLLDPSPQPLRLACSRGGESASASSCLWTSAVAVLRAAAVQRGPAHLAPDAPLCAEGCREGRDHRSWRPANVTPDAAAPFPSLRCEQLDRSI